MRTYGAACRTARRGGAACGNAARRARARASRAAPCGRGRSAPGGSARRGSPGRPGTRGAGRRGPRAGGRRRRGNGPARAPAARGPSTARAGRRGRGGPRRSSSRPAARAAWRGARGSCGRAAGRGGAAQAGRSASRSVSEVGRARRRGRAATRAAARSGPLAGPRAAADRLERRLSPSGQRPRAAAARSRTVQPGDAPAAAGPSGPRATMARIAFSPLGRPDGRGRGRPFEHLLRRLDGPAAVFFLAASGRCRTAEIAFFDGGRRLDLRRERRCRRSTEQTTEAMRKQTLTGAGRGGGTTRSSRRWQLTAHERLLGGDLRRSPPFAAACTAQSRAAAIREASVRASGKRPAARPCCSVLRSSPGPRSSRSISASRKPSSVAANASSRAFVASPGSVATSRQPAGAPRRPTRPRI